MHHIAALLPPKACLRCVLISCAVVAPAADARGETSPGRTSVDFTVSSGRLTAGWPDASAANMRTTWQSPNGHVVRTELLREKKFDRSGGVAAAGYTRVLSTEWSLSGDVLLGHGPQDWARMRIDIEVAKTWGPRHAFVTRAAAYHARYDAARSDRGLRFSAVSHAAAPLVVEAGVIVNRSEPGKVHATMPFAAATWGHDGRRYVSLRLSRGTEAYQSIGTAQLVDFHSRSARLTWREWIGTGWGVLAEGEHYRNPIYERSTLGVGVFSQW